MVTTPEHQLRKVLGHSLRLLHLKTALQSSRSHQCIWLYQIVSSCMSSMLPTRSLSRLLPHRPATTRHHKFVQARGFSAGARQLNAGADPVSQCADYLLQGIHGLGLPWYFVIPSAAVLVRGVLVYHIATKPNRRNAQIRSHLVPLSLAQSQQRAFLQSRERQPSVSKTPISSSLRSMREFFSYQRILISNSFKFDVPAISWRTPVNLMVLLLLSDVIRQKCNAHAGLSTILMGPFKRLFGAQEPGTSQEISKSRDELLADLLEKQRNLNQGTVDYIGSASSDSAASLLSSAQATTGQSPLFEPALVKDGLPWCMDLTAADPYMILPGLLGATLCASVLYRRVKLNMLSDGRSILRMDQPLTVMERISLSFGLLITMASTQWPAALLLYFIPSITVGWVQQWWLDRKLPIIPPIVPNRQQAARMLRQRWKDEKQET